MTRSRLNDHECRDCGAPIRLVLVIPSRLEQGTKRRRIPLDVDLPDGVEPSHAVALDSSVCYPVTRERPIDSTAENPAVTHFATCPARDRRRHGHHGHPQRTP